GHVYGVEGWIEFRATDWWTIAGGFNAQHMALRFQPGSAGIAGIAAAGNDPEHQFSVRSTFVLAPSVRFTADLRHVASLPSPAVPAYTEIGARATWAMTEHLEVSVAGRNLLHDQHVEFSNQIPRSGFIEARWRF